ncbi:MAG: 5-formyltetrahydrofolate cyclo-ligase [Candidatus Thermoplasmatota archaeon]|nr:5-formyltetrahydrofolate cyclo-ligase [Candidatus Thermoplasmatota archaeon]
MFEDDGRKMKDRLRKSIEKKRNTLSTSDVLEKSSRIKKRIFEMDLFRDAQTILFYVSYGNEVYTHDMIKESISLGKTVVVPKSVTKNNALILSRLTDWNNLEVGAYNILEPKQESIEQVDVESIDLIIVPGVVFDESGNRIGHGKGYYDRLLNDSQNIPNIGLAFEFQIVENIKSEQHDEKIDIIITEDRIIK